MRVLHFMNEAPFAFPAELCEHLSNQVDVGIAVFRSDGSVSDRLLDSPIQVHRLNANGRLDLTAYQRLAKLVANYDILHTHPNATGAVARMVCSPLDIKIVDTKHNDHSHFSRPQKYINIIGNRPCDLIVANSRSTLQRLPPYETLGLRTTWIYNGIDATPVQRAVPCSFSNPTIVSTARQVPQKDLPTLVESMEYVTRQYPNARLVLIGKGPQRSELERLVAERNLESIVEFTGYLSTREEVFEVVSGADLFALPSRYEGFGVAVVEAMAAGVPVVVSDIPVFREVVGDEGLYADVGDSESFATAIGALLDSDTERRRRGQALQARVEAEFSIERCADKYVEAYSNVI